MIRLFHPDDEAQLQHLTRQPMPGWIRLAYCNSPSFADGEALKGDEVTTAVWIESDGAIGGCASRAVKRVWLDGRIQRVGYFAGLRSFESARNKLGLFRGYEWMRELDRRDPLPLYITTIISANRPARELLTSRRAKLPAYIEAGGIVTFGVTSRAIRRSAHGDVRPPFNVLSGDEVGETRLRAFYNEVSPQRMLFPVLPDPLPTNLKWSDFVVLEKDGQIIAATALWNQQSIRQIHVDSYHPLLSILRPVINPFLKLLGYYPLPPSNTDFDCVYFAYPLTRHDTPAEFASLLAASAPRIGKRLLFFALHENNPFITNASRLTAWKYRSILYTVSFATNPEPVVFKSASHIELSTM